MESSRKRYRVIRVDTNEIVLRCRTEYEAEYNAAILESKTGLHYEVRS